MMSVFRLGVGGDSLDVRDRAMIQSRLEQNICPNGCARLVVDGTALRCPRCGMIVNANPAEKSA